MRTFKHQRVGMAVLSAFVAAITFVRCSPIAPSVAKSSLYGQGRVTEPAAPPVIDASKTTKPSLPVSARIVKYETKLLGETSFYTLEFDLDTQKVMTLSEGLVPERFEELRIGGKTEIEIESAVPKKITVVFRVSDEAILNADDVSAFDTSLDPLEDGKWTLRISSSVPKQLSEHVLKHLEAVTVVFDAPAAAPELPATTKEETPPVPSVAAVNDAT